MFRHNMGGFRPGAGRKKVENPQIYKTVGLTADQWEYMQLWFSDGSPSDQFRELLDRSRKFWPAGPGKFR